MTIKNNDILAQAVQTAVKLLARRDVSKRELNDYLKKKQFDSAVIDEAVSYLINKNWFNEARCATELCESKLRRTPAGPRFLRQFLKGKQFSQQVIDETVTRLYTRYSEQGLAQKNAKIKLKSLQRKFQFNNQDKIKYTLKNFLVRRGFSEHIIESIIDDLDRFEEK